MHPPLPPASSGPIRLGARHEAAMLVVLTALAASGVVWLVYHHLLASPDALATHPAEGWSLRLHGALAMAALVLLGSLLPHHVPTAWRRHKNRGSGGAMLGLLIFLSATGYLLYYAGSPALREAASWLHWGTGLALPVLLPLHMALGGRWRGLRRRTGARR